AGAGERRRDRVDAAEPAPLLATGEVLRDLVETLVADAARLLRHVRVALAEEPLHAVRAAVAHLGEQLSHLTLDGAPALDVGLLREREGEVAGIGTALDAVDERLPGALDRARHGAIRRIAVVVDIL